MNSADSTAVSSAPDAPSVTLTPMRRRHLPAVLAIEARVHPRPWGEALFRLELSQPETRSYIVARVGDQVVGHAGVLHIAGEGHVTTVAVDPDWQRRQIATRLMAVQVRHAIARGTHALTLEVRASNIAAQALYRVFGFVPVGVRKGYYPAVDDHPAEDALIMWAYDIDAPEMLDRLHAAQAHVVGTSHIEGIDCA